MAAMKTLSPKRTSGETGVLDKPGCCMCKQAIEMASLVLCGCEALAVFRFRHLRQHFLKPGDFEDISVSRILHFFPEFAAAKCVSKRAAQKTENGLSVRVIMKPALMIFSTLKATFPWSSDFSARRSFVFARRLCSASPVFEFNTSRGKCMRV